MRGDGFLVIEIQPQVSCSSLVEPRARVFLDELVLLPARMFR